MTRSGTLLAEEAAVGLPVNEEHRLRALERLYLRREAVDELIRSLEIYQRREAAKAPCIPINAGRKCW